MARKGNMEGAIPIEQNYFMHKFKIHEDSLRDYFAGQALIALILNESTHPSMTEFFTENVAKRAYEYADAMLKARNGKEG